MFVVAIILGAFIVAAAPFAKVVYADGNWWEDGTKCDATDYPASYQLGSASFKNVIACGPGTTMGGNYNHLITYPGATVSEYEWECVEYSMRYMLVNFGIMPWLIPGAGGAPYLFLMIYPLVFLPKLIAGYNVKAE